MSEYLSLLVLALCYTLALASIPLSFYVIRRKVGSVRCFRLLACYIMSSILAYAVWLLIFRTGNIVVDLSPLPLNLLAVLTPWILLIKQEYVGS
ncbi:MAG: hypothetical protein RMJ00_06455 [Nitrososphaerota archaeon]|nr:hypothetical protein [Candidatus Bathyarchaeota archaeon]MDW8062321.1 hypothetical protein [Nitrososphaerota archaeon]